MHMGSIIDLGVKLAAAPETLDKPRELREESPRRSSFGGIAQHGDEHNRGQRNWRYALVDLGENRAALRICDGGPHCKQWNLEPGEGNDYVAARMSDLPGEWNKSRSLRHPEDAGIHQEGRLQAHRAGSDEIYATMQDGRNNGTFSLKKDPAAPDRWKLQFQSRPKGKEEAAVDFVRSLKKSAGWQDWISSLLPRAREGAEVAGAAGAVHNSPQGSDPIDHGLNLAGGLAGGAELAQAAIKRAPSLAAPAARLAPSIGAAARFAPHLALAANTYQAKQLIQNPRQEMDAAQTSLQSQGVMGRALQGAGNPVASTAASVREAGRAFLTSGEASLAEDKLRLQKDLLANPGVPQPAPCPAPAPAPFGKKGAASHGDFRIALNKSNVKPDIKFYVAGDRCLISTGDWHREEEAQAAIALAKKFFKNVDADAEVVKPDWCEEALRKGEKVRTIGDLIKEGSFGSGDDLTGKLRQAFQHLLEQNDLRHSPKQASAFIRDCPLASLPEDVRRDIRRFVPDLKGKTAVHYGMVVKELLQKADPHNLAAARAHLRDESESKLKKEFYAKKDGKFILITYDKIIDGHHFLAKAEKIGCTSSLNVLDLTGCRHQESKSNKKAELAGMGLGRLLVKQAGGDKKLSCLMAPVDAGDPLHDQLVAFAHSIAQDDLYLGEEGEFGRETEPHVTALFGFTDPDPEPVRKFVQDKAPMTIVLDKLSSFDAGKNPYDVLKFDVKCDELTELNAALKKRFEVESDFPNYSPHVTIGYLKPGRAGKYLNRNKLVGSYFTASSLTFSDAQKNKTTIKLEGKSNTASGNLDRWTYPLTGPGLLEGGGSTLAAAGVGAAGMGLLHAYRAAKRKLLNEPEPDDDAPTLLGDVGRGALLGAAANVGFQGLSAVMGGPRRMDDHPVLYHPPEISEALKNPPALPPDTPGAPPRLNGGMQRVASIDPQQLFSMIRADPRLSDHDRQLLMELALRADRSGLSLDPGQLYGAGFGALAAWIASRLTGFGAFGQGASALAGAGLGALVSQGAGNEIRGQGWYRP
jgi:hypothetical protein